MARQTAQQMKINPDTMNEMTDIMKRHGRGGWVSGHDVDVWMTGAGSNLQETEYKGQKKLMRY